MMISTYAIASIFTQLMSPGCDDIRMCNNIGIFFLNEVRS